MKPSLRDRLHLPGLALLLSALACTLAGCGSQPAGGSTASADSDEPEISPAERPYYEAARPFVLAIAAGEYTNAYAFLSGHATQQTSLHQFVAPDDDAPQAPNNASAVRDLTPLKFAELMTSTEKRYGKPSRLGDLHVHSTDPKILSGQGTSVEDKIDAMFAIGMMPQTIPAQIRKASLRSKILVRLSSEQLAAAARAYETTPEKLQADPDFQPYVNLKVVVVEDQGTLKVGYFEFVPPGIMD